MARFNAREGKERAAAGKAVDATKRIKKTKAAEPVVAAAAKPLTSLKPKAAGARPEASKLARKFFIEYRKQEEKHMKDAKLNKAERARFLKKSALLRRKKLNQYVANPDAPINLSEIGAALEEVHVQPAKAANAKLSNRAFVRDQTADLDKMHKVAAHPVFQANPIDTLKRHLKNSLLKK